MQRIKCGHAEKPGISRGHAALALFAVLFLIPCISKAQTTAVPVGLPARAPGYDHYYHSEQPSTAFATRWGYSDGYEDGKRDRNFGNNKAAEDQDRYKMVPDHGLHPDIPRARYKTLYRSAYLNGYNYGSKF